MEYVMMKCGCVAQGTLKATGEPYCLTHRERERAETEPDLAGRIAICFYLDCNFGPRKGYGSVEYGAIPPGEKRAKAPSSLKLPDFRHQPDQPFDSYYCGCFGWD